MYGIKANIGSFEDIRWIDESKLVTRLIASIAVEMSMKKLREIENFEVLEESDEKFIAKGKDTGVIFSVNVIEVGV